MDLSIIIVSFNTKEILRNCLESVKNALSKSPDKIEVMVIDNSSDGTRQMVIQEFPEFKLIINSTNLGFAAANNIGIKKSQGQYLLLLNSDTEIFSDSLTKTFQFMKETPQAAVVTCRVELPNGRLDPACHRGFPTPWASFCYFSKLEKMFPKIKFFSGYHQFYKNLNSTHEIDSPSGAFYFVRKNIVDDVGLLDEDYFMYGEDLDWSYRIKQKHGKIFYYPFARILHFKKQSGRSSGHKDLEKDSNRYFYQTMELFYLKHFADKYPRIINWIILSGLKFRQNFV